MISQKIRIFFTPFVIPYGEHSNHYKRFVSANITDELQDRRYIYDVDLPTSCWPIFVSVAALYLTSEVCEHRPVVTFDICCHEKQS